MAENHDNPKNRPRRSCSFRESAAWKSLNVSDFHAA